MSSSNPITSAQVDKLVDREHSHDLFEHGHHGPVRHHGHVHSEESIKHIVNRLSRIEGHIRGIKTMVQEERPCPDVLVQVAAVRGALDRVARLILDEHLSACISRAVAEGDIETEITALKSALDRFLR
ncbi:MAG: metal-sensitive transcriptional regulator [Cyanobacteria bacterium J06635_1]